MEAWIIAIFFIGYLCITTEHQIKVDKTISALAMAVICWTILKVFNLDVLEVLNGVLVPVDIANNSNAIDEALRHHLAETAEILFFLIGAMTIVEIIDMHRGFEIIKRVIRTRSKVKLLWIIGIIAFFLSSIIDNLTTTIILITNESKLIHDQKQSISNATLIEIAANAGGAWSPIGDVTTTMLWVKNKVSAAKLVEYVFIPATVCLIVPLFVASFLPVFKGKIDTSNSEESITYKSSMPVLVIGFISIIFVPIFKSITHLPPYIGMLFALATMWFISEKLKPIRELSSTDKDKFSIHRALGRIEFSSILFFLGILLAVASLQTIGTLFNFAQTLNETIPSTNVVILLLGFASAIIDNVPLVAASMGMFQEPMDSGIWHYIAYAAGTGGSLLIIGSAAGVVAMGMEKINFFWYVKNILWIALLGFVLGYLTLVSFEALHVFG